jgi:Cu2+-exporting ATPase
LANGIRSALKQQMIVQSTEIFEHSAEPEQVVFDKTGTLTTGTFRVTEIQFSDPDKSDPAIQAQILDHIYALESQSNHPVGQAICEYLRTRVSSDNGISNSEVHLKTYDRGVYGTMNGQKVWIGRSDWLRTQSDIPEYWNTIFHNIPEQQPDAAQMTIWGVVEDLGWVQFRMKDHVRPEANHIIQQLHQIGKKIMVLTGDRQSATKYWEQHPAVDRVFAEVRPESKASIISQLNAHAPTAMVGDGINDAGAMSSASVGITFGNRSALARSAGDLVIPNDDLSVIPFALQLSTQVRRRIYQNLGWALLYNATAIPLAIAGWINPLFAAVAMIGSSLLVILNSTRDIPTS